jgi:hypothetical protein
MFSNTRASTAVLALAATVVALPAAAQEVKFMADLQPAEGVDSQGMGMADVTVDTEAMTVTWTMTAEGLTGEAGAAHFHGPATPEETAPPVIDMTVDGTDETEEPVAQDILEGRADLTEEQLADLQAGLYYINVHTAEYPDGEIRGQVIEGEADMSAMGGDAASDAAAPTDDAGTTTDTDTEGEAASTDTETDGAATTEGDAASTEGAATTEGDAATDTATEGAATTEGDAAAADTATEGDAATEGEAASE